MTNKPQVRHGRVWYYSGDVRSLMKTMKRDVQRLKRRTRNARKRRRGWA